MDSNAILAEWEGGETDRAARAIYDALPLRLRPGWAADILELVCSRLSAVPEPVKAVSRLAAIRGGSGPYTPRRNAQGADTITYTVTDRFGGTATGTLTVNVTDITKPLVAEVRVYYSVNRYVVVRDFFRVLGWSNINRIDVRFTEGMNVTQGDLLLNGTLSGAVASTGFSYSPTTFIASWRFNPLALDRYTLQLPTSGATDLHGNTFATAPTRRFGVLPGDLDGNGLVSSAELATVRRNLGKRYAVPLAADVDGDGVVTLADVSLVRSFVNRRLPS